MSETGKLKRGEKFYSLKALATFNKDKRTLDWLKSQPSIESDIKFFEASKAPPKAEPMSPKPKGKGGK